jgi:hypothetical protein
MFEQLSERLSETLRRVAGKATLNEDNIRETLREVRQALLEADVALPVVTNFIEQVRAGAVGQDVMKSLSPGQAFLRIVHSELVRAMGLANESIDLAAEPPAVILMAGLQGSGKTTAGSRRRARSRCWSARTSTGPRPFASWRHWRRASASASCRATSARSRSISRARRTRRPGSASPTC